MAADVIQIPSDLQNIFVNISNNLSDHEKTQANEAVKQLYGKKITLDPKDFLKTQKELFRLGAISQEGGLSFLSRVTKNASKKEEIEGLIKEYKPDETSKFVGREKELKEVCIKLSNGKLNVPGFNLFGQSGVGKTMLAQEIAKRLPRYQAITIDLKDIADVSNVYFHVLDKFGLLSWDKDKQRILDHLKANLQTKSLLILDNIEQLLDSNDRDEFLLFLYQMVSSEACKTGNLKVLLTSVQELQDRKLKGRFFSDYLVKPLSKDVSKSFISLPEKQLLKPPEEEDESLSEIAKLCQNLPYLLQAVKQMMREGFKDPSQVLERLKGQIENNVPEKYACILEQFESIPNKNLKDLAVKISLLRRPFSVETAMKIAGLPPTPENLYSAAIDIELLSVHKVISKVDEKEAMYDIHSLFQEFVTDYLCKQFEEYKGPYSEGEGHFFQHFSGQMMQVAKLLDHDFVEAYKKCEVDKANFELAIDISKTNNEVFDTLLHSDQHNQLALVGILFEVMKDSEERKNLFNSWAETAEKSGKWLDSVNLRSWQAMQGADLESTEEGNQALQIAETSLKKAHENGATQEQFNAAKSLILHSQGRLHWQKASKMAISSDKDEDKNRIDLIKEGLFNLEEALKLQKETSEEKNTTMKARTLNLIGNCYMELNEPDKAETAYVEAMEMKRQLIGSDLHWEMPTYYNQIAQVHERRGLKIEKSYGGFLDFFLKSKYKSEYIKAVEWMEKALKLEEELGVGDTEHTATFQRNLANSLIGIGEYDKALEYAEKCHEARLERYGEHPETVNILYLIGIIHEYRRDREAACESYETAFEMEEKLAYRNHSRSREKIRDRLNEMYRALKMKEKEKELQYKIEEINERDEDHISDYVFQPPLYANVNQHGGTYNQSVNGFVLSFPENCISMATRITCDTKLTIPSPVNTSEHLVSSVVRLGPSSVELKKPLEVTLLHCGPGFEEGYEKIVKVFDEERQVWQETKAIQEARPPPVKLKTDYIETQLTKLTAVAVVTRPITDTFEVTVDGCEITSSWCKDIKLCFPQGSVDGSITGKMQVLPVPGQLIKDPGTSPLPILLFRGFKDVTFNKPVQISLPVTVEVKKEDVRLLRTRLDDISTPTHEWEDITKDVSQIKVEENKVEIEVEQFCALWGFISAVDVVKTAYSLYKVFDNPPCSVSFAAYQSKGPRSKDNFKMKLTCVANNKQLKLTETLEKQGYVFLDDSTADHKMRKNEQAHINVQKIDKSKWQKDFFLEFLGEEECKKPFIVETKHKEVHLEFHRNKNLKGDRLCVLPVEKQVEAVSDELPWVEYCGIEFDALRDLPDQIFVFLVHHFTQNDLRDRMDIWYKQWDDGGRNKFLSSLHLVAFDEVLKGLEEFCGSESRNTYFPQIVRLLEHGHSLTHEPLDNMATTAQEKITGIASQISTDNYEIFARTLGLSNEVVVECESSPSKIFDYWYDNYKTLSTSCIADLFNALRACEEKDLAKELAMTITQLARTKLTMENQSYESSV